MDKSKVCLGCGAKYDGPDCAACARKRIEHLRVYGQWPLEVSLSAGALAAVENAILFFLSEPVEADQISHEHTIELQNLTNTIRSYWQHVAAGYTRAPEATQVIAKEKAPDSVVDDLFL